MWYPSWLLTSVPGLSIKNMNNLTSWIKKVMVVYYCSLLENYARDMCSKDGKKGH